MMQGIVKKVMDKGFGFIEPISGGKDIFFHASSLCDGLEFDATLVEREVEFDREVSDRGPHAVRVRPIR